MKTENLFNGLKEAGFDNLSLVGKDVKVNIGYIAKKIWQNDYATERACFDDLKLQVLNWASIHGTSCKREGGAVIVYGE